MSKIGFKEVDVVIGGQYHDVFYDQVVVKPRKFIQKGNYKVVGVNDSAINYAWLVANKANIKWEGVGIFVELPVSYKTANAPNWLTNYQYIDENGLTKTHTLESYGKVREDSLDGAKFVMKVSVHKDLTLSQLKKLVTFINGEPLATGMVTSETRDLLNGIGYTAP